MYYTACQCTLEGLPHISLLAEIQAAAGVCCRDFKLRPCRLVCLFTSCFQLPQFLRPVITSVMTYNPPCLCHLNEWANVFLVKWRFAYNNPGKVWLSPNAGPSMPGVKDCRHRFILEGTSNCMEVPETVSLVSAG